MPYIVDFRGNRKPVSSRNERSTIVRQFAINFGIPESQILMESISRNTYENAVQTQRLIQEHGLSKIILVTTAIHLPRAIACFHKLGIEPITYIADFQLAPEKSIGFQTSSQSWGPFRDLPLFSMNTSDCSPINSPVIFNLLTIHKKSILHTL